MGYAIFNYAIPTATTVSATPRKIPIYCVETEEKKIAVSFDAAWGNEDTQQLIDILAQYQVQATFFVVGDWVDKYPESVKALHDAGIGVVMDVVYNHVYNASAFNFNLIVPGYFSRVDEEGNYSNGSGCGNDTASERSMVKKYIVDSVNYWADEYHIDGFRFDLVGLIDTETVNEIVEEVHKNHPNVIFYGEGWTMGTTVTKPGYTMATQLNSTETPDFAYFSDNIRNLVRGSSLEPDERGYVYGEKGITEKLQQNCLMKPLRSGKNRVHPVNSYWN